MARVKICRKHDCHNTIPYAQDNTYCEIHKAMYQPKPEFKPSDNNVSTMLTSVIRKPMSSTITIRGSIYQQD
jgi:hypothetical protein